MLNGRNEYIKIRANLETIELCVDEAQAYIEDNKKYDISKDEIMAFLMKIEWEGNDQQAIYEAIQQAYYYGFDAGRRFAEEK